MLLMMTITQRIAIMSVTDSATTHTTLGSI